MPRVTGDFAGLLKSAADGAIDLSEAAFALRACVGVVIATADYPRANTPVSGLPHDVDLGSDAQIFWGNSKVENGSVSSGGGRVLTVTGLGNDLPSARQRAYDAVHALAGRMHARNLTFRTDIGKF
jgi:phosphoribosylamine--glycine ligase